MSEKYTNDHGKECYRGVEDATPMGELEFHDVSTSSSDNVQIALHTDIGSLTVLERMTGFGWRDIETGYRDTAGAFWLASGGCDVRTVGVETFADAVAWVKTNANTCVNA